MASWTPDAPPVRAGDYARFLATPVSTLPPSTGDVLAVPVVEDWGPLAEWRLVDSLPEYVAIYGAPAPGAPPSPGYIAAYYGFKGAGGDEPGAGSLLVYRMSNGAVKASRALAAGANNAALTLTAKYEGTRGNRIGYEVLPNAANPTTQVDMNIYLDLLVVEQYRGYTSAQITNLQADINSRSKYVDASGAVNGTLLTAVALTQLTGGNSGTALTPANWSSMMDSAEAQQFGALAPYDLTDASVQTSLISWAKGLNDASQPGAKPKPFELIVSGALDETYGTASGRSLSADSEHLVNWFLPRSHDTVLDIDVSGSQLAPRIGGLVAHRGGRSGYTFALLTDLEIVTGPTDFEALSSLTDGVMTATLGVAGVQVEQGVTSLVTDTPEKPRETFGKLKYVLSMKDFQRQLRQRHEDGKTLGLLTNNKDTREHIVSDANDLLKDFIKDKQVQAGSTVTIAPDPPPSDDDEFVALNWTGKFARELRQVLNTFYFS